MKRDEVDLLVDDIDVDDIDSELAEFTSELSRAGYKLALATRDVATAKQALELIGAEARLKFRHTADLQGRRINDKLLDAHVITLDTYQDALRAVIDATTRRDMYRSMVATLEQKGRHIDVLGRRMTAEFNATKYSRTT